jgi:phosphoribosylamine--glycine ligase
MVFHSGTAVKNGVVSTNGGRVLCVTGIGGTIQDAVRRAYQTLGVIRLREPSIEKTSLGGH